MNNWLKFIEKNKIWKFTRYITSISSQEKLFGLIKWEQINNKVYKYIETGTFKTKPFSRTYIYDFNKKEVFFEDKTLFFKFPQSGQEAIHVCNKDTYLITSGDNFIQYDVSGPHKNYTARTVFNF